MHSAFCNQRIVELPPQLLLVCPPVLIASEDDLLPLLVASEDDLLPLLVALLQVFISLQQQPRQPSHQGLVLPLLQELAERMLRVA